MLLNTIALFVMVRQWNALIIKKIIFRFSHLTSEKTKTEKGIRFSFANLKRKRRYI